MHIFFQSLFTTKGWFSQFLLLEIEKTELQILLLEIEKTELPTHLTPETVGI